MNLNDYKDTNGNVEVSEQLIADIIDEVNKIKPSLVFSSATLIPYTTDYLQAVACECNVNVSGAHIIIQVGHTTGDTRGDRKYFIQPNASIGVIRRDRQQGEAIDSYIYYRAVGTQLMLYTQQNTPVYIRKIWIASDMFE